MSPVWCAVRRICTVLLIVLSQIIGSRAVQCPFPNVDNASKLSGFTGPYNLNSVVRFRCRPQYKMIGSDTVKCNESSKWEPELPKCVGTCRSVPRYQYAELVETTTELNFPEGTILKYRCKEGYEPIPGAVNTVTCLRLHWSSSPEFCKPIACVEPETVPNGRIISGSFFYGSHITYACETGYKIKNGKSRKCLSDQSWSLPIPECEVQTCATPTYLQNGWYSPVMEEYFYNDTITYNCQDGFLLVGQVSITCGSDGRWNYNTPVCRGICDAPPDLPYAQLQYQYQNMKTFFTGTTLQYVCRPGYYQDYSFSNTITCLGNFTWSTISEFCKIYKCPTPAYVNNGWYDPQMEEYFYNDTVTYGCHEGFQLVGQASITCLDQGRWNYNTPECRGICDAPPDLPYAQLQYQYQNIKTFFTGTTLQYVCRPGYYQDYSYANYITCLGNFTWSTISEFCKIYTCPTPAYVNNGWYAPEMKEYFYNDTVTYGCQEGFQLVGQPSLTCVHQGQWNYHTPECRGICDAPPDLPYAQLQFQYQNIKTFYTGTTLQYVCRPGYYQDYSYANSITCLGNFTWSTISEFCKIYTCPIPAYVNNGWYDPEMEEYFYNDTVTYGCHEGFQLVGQDSVTCVDQGRWNYNTPECRGICGEPPELHFAQLDLRFKHITTFFVGSSVQYNCRPGYIQNNMYSNTIACLGNFTWSQIPEFCSRRSCGSPPKVRNAVLEAKAFLFESEAVYKCEKGYKMASQSNYLKCGSNGRWQGALTICEAQKCLAPGDIKDGSYNLKKDEYNYNESVTYKCDTLQLVGKASLTCTDEGKWSSDAPQCRAVCTFPPELDFAVVEEEFIHQEYFDNGTSVQYKCRPGFVPITGKNNKVTCLSNLKWSQHEQFCTPISCSDPGAIDHGQMQSENFLFGSRVTYTCNPGYSMVSKRNYRECQADGTWSGKPPVCKEPVCDKIWELQEEARKCTSTPDEWIKYLQVQYLYLQIENMKLDIELKKRQLGALVQTNPILDERTQRNKKC